MANDTIDLFADTRVLVLSDKKTGEFRGSIIGRWTKAGVCRVLIRAKMPDGEWMVLPGKAGGYGYDRFSAAIVNALHKTPYHGAHDEIYKFVFCNTPEEHANKAEIGRALVKKGIIPVYSGAGNEKEAFGLYYQVEEIL